MTESFVCTFNLCPIFEFFSIFLLPAITNGSLHAALSVTLLCPSVHPKIGFCSLTLVASTNCYDSFTYIMLITTKLGSSLNLRGAHVPFSIYAHFKHYMQAGASSVCPMDTYSTYIFKRYFLQLNKICQCSNEVYNQD